MQRLRHFRCICGHVSPDCGVSGCDCRGKQVALDAARGLAYLHRKRIAWLDCKSSNVLLTKCEPDSR